MKKAIILTFLISLTMLSGCAEVAYDILQDNQIDNCKKMMEPDRSQCMKNNSTDYNTYKKERDKAIRGY
jgi:protein involved in sex pheromone biosynthesis